MKCPHACTDKDFAFTDCLEEPGAVPSEGDIGVCYRCGGWWRIVNGKAVQYLPTEQEQRFATSQMSSSRQRFQEFIKRR